MTRQGLAVEQVSQGADRWPTFESAVPDMYLDSFLLYSSLQQANTLDSPTLSHFSTPSGRAVAASAPRLATTRSPRQSCLEVLLLLPDIMVKDLHILS